MAKLFFFLRGPTGTADDAAITGTSWWCAEREQQELK